MTDETAGEAHTLPGSANTGALIRAANHHNGEQRFGAEGNRIARGALPLVRPQNIGKPTAAAPLGLHFEDSLVDGGGE
jgi:hypothetical protein